MGYALTMVFFSFAPSNLIGSSEGGVAGGVVAPFRRPPVEFEDCSMSRAENLRTSEHFYVEVKILQGFKFVGIFRKASLF